MTTLKPMYDGVAGSPQTIITVQYIAGASATITVEDASVLPGAPNRVVLQRSSDSAFVTVFYGSRVGNILGSLTVEAGFTGTYPVGSTAARRFCEGDHEELRDNITALNSGKAELNHSYRHTGEGDDAIPVVSQVAGLMSPDDKHKLDSMEYGAKVNRIESVKVGGTALPITSKAVDITNVPSATKLATTRAIDGVNFDGSADVSRYGVCATIAKTAAKAVSISGYTLVSGAVSVVKFTNGNVANSPTLNITSTGAKPITRKGVAISPEKIEVGGTYVFVYDGTNYEIIGSYFDNSPITIHGMIIDETNSDPRACISYIGASAGMDLEARKNLFMSLHPLVVVKGAKELFAVDPNDWSKKLDGTDSGVTTDGLSLDGNFMTRYPTFWFRVQTLGTDIHSIEWTHDNPGSGNGWVCCHWRDGTIRKNIWVGVTKGVVSDNKLRAIYSDTELPSVSMTSEQFYTAAQATGTAEGVTDENTYTITQPLVYMMRCILKYWTYGTLNLQTDVARGLVDDTDSVNGRRPVCVGVSPTGGYTQGIAASSQAYTDNVSAVVNGEIDPYGNILEHMIDFAYRFGEIAFATDSADHFDITTLTIANWDSAIPASWSKVTGVGTTSGYVRKMHWNASFPFISASTGGSTLTYWSDDTNHNAEDTAENKVPRCCVSGGGWANSSGAGPVYLRLSRSVDNREASIGARLQIFSKE